jgi:class 3 adenylate cyclase
LVKDDEPEQFTASKNRVVGFMNGILSKHKGIVNQFLSDGFMATFGVPRSFGNGCRYTVDPGVEIIRKLNDKV